MLKENGICAMPPRAKQPVPFNLKKSLIAGGLGFALRMLGAEMVKGAALVMEHTGFHRALAGADLVLTGEGCSDDQTACGKLCSEIARATAAPWPPFTE